MLLISLNILIHSNIKVIDSNQYIKIDDSMASHEGLGAVIGNGGELSSGFDVFEVPTPSGDVVSSRDIEIRLSTVLDR